jgi:hypothetical protein
LPSSYSDYRDLLDGEPALDLVSVCTMADTHREIVIGALPSGANVLCDKPFARNRHEGLEMAEEAATVAGRLLTVGFNMRYMSASTAVRRFVETGDLLSGRCRARSTRRRSSTRCTHRPQLDARSLSTRHGPRGADELPGDRQSRLREARREIRRHTRGASLSRLRCDSVARGAESGCGREDSNLHELALTGT